ncbi:MAG: hypothetical protein M5U26_06570 [Planctomycetota bacterium]|nr:hypothetical protein [Planctomycetota bacterium]
MSEFKKIRTRVIEFHKNISALRSELEKVGVKIDKVESGMFEIGIILPSAPSKDLSTLVKQLKDIEFVMQTVQEAAGAPASSPNVRMIGSSNWEIFSSSCWPRSRWFGTVPRKNCQYV